jgi:hypothetical protein
MRSLPFDRLRANGVMEVIEAMQAFELMMDAREQFTSTKFLRASSFVTASPTLRSMAVARAAS